MGGTAASAGGDHAGQAKLLGTNGQAVRIEKLWAITPGNNANGGADTLWFSAGPSDGRHGIVGQLIPAAS
jgi:hypothetical protein